jgi:Leucine-rich repeat (LRR) protein
MSIGKTFTLQELSEATSHWSPSKILGQGGFAVVYLGQFAGERAAIKKVLMPKKDKERAFVMKSMHAEMITMSHYKHQNVCELIGSYVDQESESPTTYCLVYELCVNGSLLDRLACRDHKCQDVPALTEQQRLVITLGICRALEYLHVKADPPIVHRDIKTANILLDEMMCPKIADFGTVRQDKVADGSTHVKTATVVGTRCYMPSEYLSGGEISVKTDSYAFGVVLCELLTGINPMEKPLIALIEDALEANELTEVLDKKATWTNSEQALQLATIALRCTAYRKMKRATVQEVLPAIERLHDPNYNPTILAVGSSYYHPETGMLVQGGAPGGAEGGAEDDDGERYTLDPRLRAAEDYGMLQDPLLGKHDGGGDYDAIHAGNIRSRGYLILAALVMSIAGLCAGVLLSHRHRPPSAASSGCIGQSVALVSEDCRAWQDSILPSLFFVQANPPACARAEYRADPCSCAGVIGCEGGHIVEINLSGRELAFEMSSDDSLIHLRHLRQFNFSNNSLNGSIPQWLRSVSGLTSLSLKHNNFGGGIHLVAELSSLRYLQLSNNGLSGPIDAVAELSSLEYMSLSDNLFSGTIDAVGDLTSLSVLEAAGNRLNGIIHGVKELKNLQTLCLDGNQFHGSIGVVEQLTNLRVLSLSENSFHGDAHAVERLSSLEHLSLHSNEFNGSIEVLAGLKNLSRLWLMNNHFTGTISVVQQLPNLSGLWMSNNSFSGPIDALKYLRVLRELDLFQNQLTGSLSPVATLTSLTRLSLALNRLSGPIDGVAGLLNLTWLDLGFNNLSGSIDAVENLTRLQKLSVVVNDFSGPINAVAKLEHLVYLHLTGNQFTGPIATVADLVHLEELLLHSNHLVGPVDAVTPLTSLKKLDLCFNSFDGTLPSSLGLLTKLTYLELYGNKLRGTIPPMLAQLTVLRYFHFGQNPQISGTIPVQFSKLRALTSIDWSSCNLTGSIDALAQLRHLTVMDIRNNRFAGTIDAVAQLESLTRLDLSGNNFTGSITAVENLTSVNFLHLNLKGALRHNDFSGAIPTGPIDWGKIGDCDIEGNHFANPLPAGAASNCKATGDHLACDGNSADLNDADCRIWQQVVAPSKYFTTAEPPACNEPRHHADPCSCEGVVGCQDGRIVSINLGRRALSFNASEDDSLSHLNGLQRLDLSYNKLVGSLPQWLERLAGSLLDLALDDNQLGGTLDVVAKLGKLTSLDLRAAFLVGTLHPLAQLSSLVSLDLRYNLVHGSIDALAKLTSLTTLLLDTGSVGTQYQLSGNINALTKLTSLTTLSLAYQQFNGSIAVVKEFTSLVSLSLTRNHFTGTIDHVTNLKSLTFLSLATNNFIGTIPPGLADIKGLTRVDLSVNKLTGTIPPGMADIKGLVSLDLIHNKLSGAVPPLPFEQYTSDCHLDAPDGDAFPCVEPNCNHFSCPLPNNSALCTVRQGATGPSGVHCYNTTNWLLGAAGDSCTTACSAIGRVCVAEYLQVYNASFANAIFANVAPGRCLCQHEACTNAASVPELGLYYGGTGGCNPCDEFAHQTCVYPSPRYNLPQCEASAQLVSRFCYCSPSNPTHWIGADDAPTASPEPYMRHGGDDRRPGLVPTGRADPPFPR